MDGIERSSIPVPKFPSFRKKESTPKPTNQSSSQGNIQHNSKLDQNTSHRKASRHHDSTTLKHHRGRNHTSHAKTSLNEHPQLPHPSDTDRKYLIDLIGDEDNLRYGSIHRYNIPAYRRSGYGSVIGLRRKQKIDRDLSNDKYLVIPHGNDFSGVDKRHRRILNKLKSDEGRLLLPLVDQAIDTDADYVPLEQAGRTNESAGHETAESESSVSEDDLEFRYMSKRRDSPVGAVGHDLKQKDEKYNEAEDAVSHARMKGAELARKLESDPQNGELWLELMRNQEQLLLGYGLNPTQAEQEGLADLKLSIAQKALRKVTDEEQSEKLLYEMMSQAQVLWETPKLIKKWKAILAEHSTFISLWMQYLNFLQTNLSTFQVDDIRELFGEIMQVLNSISQTSLSSSNQVSKLKCYIVLRLTLYLKESGYNEQALAIWQMNFEFNFFRPGNLRGVSFTTLKTKFEEYWDSEVSRIGDDLPIHWSIYNEKGGKAPDVHHDNNNQLSGECDIDTWLNSERMAEQNNLPARTLDDVVEDDPYRVILFNDIDAFMIEVGDNEHQSLLQAFLAFFHLPPLSINTDVVSWWWDPFVRNDTFMTPTKTEMSHQFSIDLPYYRFFADILFTRSGSWSTFPSPQTPNEVLFVRRFLLSLVDRNIGGEQLAEHFLVYEVINYPDASKKTAKRLLKKYSSNLSLYNAYALIEWRLGSSDVAEKVFATAISMFTSNANSIRLWLSWIWKLLEEAGPESALLRLLSMSDTTVDAKRPIKPESFSRCSATGTIRVHRLLKDSRDRHLSSGEYDLASEFSTMLMLLSYLTTENPLSACIESITSSLDRMSFSISSSSIHHERLCQSLAKLIHYHMEHVPGYSPRIIRAVIEDCINKFPQNSIFMSIFGAMEQRFRLDDRVRSTVTRLLQYRGVSDTSLPGAQEKETVLTHSFAINAELSRFDVAGANQHSIRNTYERAVSSEPAKCSAVIWASFIRWEYVNASKERARAVWWRAVRACPWVKVLWILPWELDKLLEKKELKDIMETMRDKAIRIRIMTEE